MRRTFSIAVIGLGKIGLPIAAQYASKGRSVVGVDSSSNVVRTVNEGGSHIIGEPFLAERVRDAVSAGLLRATDDIAAAVAPAEVVVVVVPLLTGTDGKADFRKIDEVTQAIGSCVKAETVIVYETTLPLGTTRGRLAPVLEQRSGLKLGHNLFLAFSPERVSSGRVFQDLATYPKIVGGVDPQSTAKAAAFYSSVLDAQVIPVTDAETAEYAKLAETTYRFVNIALADELALFGRNHRVNVSEAFASANTQPFSHIHQPSIGIGGHCIPVYPQFLLERAEDGDLSLIRTAKQVDDAMASVYVDWLADTLDGLDAKRILLLGVCYRADVRETAYSAAFSILRALWRHGAKTLVNDPLFSVHELTALGFEGVELDAVGPVDAVIVQAFHRQYHDLDWRRFKGLRAVVDGRGAMSADIFDGMGLALLSLATAVGNLPPPGD